MPRRIRSTELREHERAEQAAVPEASTDQRDRATVGRERGGDVVDLFDWLLCDVQRGQR